MENKLFENFNEVFTLNGALTNATSQNPVLDLFFLAGACRNETEDNICIKIQQAYLYDKLLTLKLIFWAGDIREGAGERRFFRIALNFLEKNYPKDLEVIIELIPFYNRWDSVFSLKNIKALELVKKALDNKDYLCAKWLPRQSSNKFRDFRIAFQKQFKLSPRAYRKLIVGLSKTVEQEMSKKEWDKINYSAVPSVAMNNYSNAFKKQDKIRFESYLEKVSSGKEKINARAIFPYQIYQAYKNSKDQSTINLQWNALPNYMEGSQEKILPVCDVSGSMSGLPMNISVSLGIYISERNNSIFKDGFITFSGNPKLQYLKGSLVERIRQLENAEWDQNTNLQKVFDIILVKAKEGKITQEDMPTKILIISDMEFDQACSDKTNFQIIKEKYEEAGYKLPAIIFWNVNGRIKNIPSTIDDNNVALVSGASPSILKSVLKGDVSFIKTLLDTLNVERYKRVDNLIK